MSAAATATSSLSAAVWGMMIGVPIVISFGQVLFKQAGDAFADREFNLIALAFHPAFLIGGTLYALATFAWVFVLKSAPLAYAYTFMALTYIMVPLLAVAFLGERLDLRYAIGMSVILLGLFIIHGR